MRRSDNRNYYELSDFERSLPDGSFDHLLTPFVSKAFLESLAYRLIDQSVDARNRASDQGTAPGIQRLVLLAEVKKTAALYAIEQASPLLQAELGRIQNFGGECFLPDWRCEQYDRQHEAL